MRKPFDDAPRKAAIHLRISHDREMDGLAIERQREDCERLAEFKRWEVVKTYTDQSISALPDRTQARLPPDGGRLRGREVHGEHLLGP